ncbi:MAG TPA: GAF and ANTAR domain-containing protein [Acidimicrobiales bacterium]|jgi:GAF domain-containing protein|nr:GAF and ANTAR domain-containing protein [Acidimicrobiales bacterium]
MAREELLARTFIELADTLVDDFDIIEVSQRLMESCVELFDASAAGLLISDTSGRLRVIASSSEQLRTVELFELQASEGPCLECFLSGQPVINMDLSVAGSRWERFGPVALGAGFRSVHALPVRLRQEVVGALNLFRTTAGPIEPFDVAAAQALADATAIAIVQQRTLTDSRLLASQLSAALESRVVIEQAKGMVAERTGLTIGDAFIRLRAYARANNERLTAVCRSIVEGRIGADALDSEHR